MWPQLRLLLLLRVHKEVTEGNTGWQDTFTWTVVIDRLEFLRKISLGFDGERIREHNDGCLALDSFGPLASEIGELIHNFGATKFAKAASDSVGGVGLHELL